MTAAQAASDTSYSAAPLGLDASRALAERIASARFEDLSPEAIHAARRGVLDWLGCTIAGTRDEVSDGLFAGLSALGSAPVAPVPGTAARLSAHDAALAIGALAHAQDYDDTHLGEVVLHTSAPALGALAGAAWLVPASGRDLILAYAMAFEAGVRVGRAAPLHHAAGWHPTGTIGCIAAAAAASKLLGLDADGTLRALGLAAGQAAGLQQNRGTMAKPYQCGKAAANGLMAAVMARAGLDASPEAIEGKIGFVRVYNQPPVRPEALTDNWGQPWEIESNGFKPYACGVVLHPPIDATLALRAEVDDPAEVAELHLAVHPAAVRVTGIRHPMTGLQGKFSLHHSAAVAFLDGAAGIAQYSDARATSVAVATFRDCIQATIDDSLVREAARGTLVTKDGRRFEVHVPFCTGSAQNPISDAGLEEKFVANAAPVLGDAAVRSIVRRIGTLETEPDVKHLIEGCCVRE